MLNESLKRIRSRKTVGPENIPIEEHVQDQAQRCVRSKKIPNKWRRSTLMPIFKNKGNIQNCANYSEIELIIHTMKL